MAALILVAAEGFCVGYIASQETCGSVLVGTVVQHLINMADAPLASRQGGNTGKPEHRWKKKNKSKRRGKGKGKWKKVEANEPPKDAQPQAQAAEEKEQPEEHDVEQVENEAKAFEAADSSPEDGAHETSEAEPSNSPDEEETGGAEAGAENTETKEGEGTAEGAERSEPASPRIHTEEQKEERSSRARHVLQSKEEVGIARWRQAS